MAHALVTTTVQIVAVMVVVMEVVEVEIATADLNLTAAFVGYA